MRQIAKLSCFAVAAAVIAGVGFSAPVQARDLTVVGWGGSYQEAQRKAYFDPYIKKSGNKLLDESYNGEMAKIKAMVETSNVTWDVVQVEEAEMILGCEEGLFETLDWSRIGGKASFLPAAVSECGVGTIYWSVILAYDADKIKGDGPKTWADFFNTAKWPGKRALRKGPKSTLEIALMADGVAPGDVYKVLGTKEGINRAFKKLDAIKGDIQWWEAGAQPPQWLAAGDVVMTSAYNGRITAANKEGRNFKIGWDGQVYFIDSWIIVKGSSNIDKAYGFIQLASQPQTQANLAAEIPYGPTHVKAAEFSTPEVLAGLPTSPTNLKTALGSDTQFWVENIEALNERFNTWAAQ